MTLKEFAAALNLSEGHTSKMVKSGMPRNDLEAARAWLAERAAGLAFEGLEKARANGSDILLIDTAGRLQNKAGLMAELEPQRKYKHLPLLEATEAAQPEEWALEFKHRAENYLLSIGTIPADQLEAMRKHPDFDAVILPHIKHKMALLENARTRADAANLLTGTSGLLLTQRDDDSTAT